MEGQYFNETNPPEPWQAYGPNSTCTLDLCSVKWSVFTYRPSLAANIVFACLFGMAFFIHLYQGWRNKTYFFAGAILCGCAGEVIGYIGRISLYFNPFSFPAFVIATVTITLSPAFLCAAIYVTLSQVIIHLCPTCSRLNPRLAYALFIPCDLISLALQAAGGGVSSNSIGIDPAGTRLTLAGLGFQVATLTLFLCLAADYVGIYWRRHGKDIQHIDFPLNGSQVEMTATDEAASTQTTTSVQGTSRNVDGDGHKHHQLPPLSNRQFQIFLFFLTLSTVLILIRCCYRIAELKAGYFGHLFHDEPLFVALESMYVGEIRSLPSTPFFSILPPLSASRI
ncbi:hypothetical protein B0A52_02791 [Exophiala mesophila]|uniref:Sphingoid long-chain base transporter RSB1 n=1 Tax=Exophiala mesophila TaxID=212818 RepID=A0A438NDZ3_EXOME|nr:hypothetical protein B0A52_02791 [Exophiala mesophila]